jgi:hypothetical protein
LIPGIVYSIGSEIKIGLISKNCGRICAGNWTISSDCAVDCTGVAGKINVKSLSVDGRTAASAKCAAAAARCAYAAARGTPTTAAGAGVKLKSI